MYGSQDGDIDEDALSSILKTALGVAELSVTNLFRAIDQEGTGRITFGEWPGSRGRRAPLYGGCAQEAGLRDTVQAKPMRAHQGTVLSCATQNSQKEDSSSSPAGTG